MRKSPVTILSIIFATAITAAISAGRQATAQTPPPPPTITITTPANNATVNCSVLIDGLVTLNGYYEGEMPFVAVTNSVTQQKTFAPYHSSSWDTTSLSNGTYELQAELYYGSYQGYPGGIAYSNIITATVQMVIFWRVAAV